MLDNVYLKLELILLKADACYAVIYEKCTPILDTPTA